MKHQNRNHTKEFIQPFSEQACDENLKEKRRIEKSGRSDKFPMNPLKFQHGRKMLALVLIALLVISMSTSFILFRREDPKTDLKYVFVHGLSGWGSYDAVNNVFPYWGTSHGSVINYLNQKGYDCYAASVDPTGSAWDRACELYAQLTGTRTDYGKAHSERCHHDQYGPDFTGRALLDDFEHSRIVLLGHSFGGATVRMFSYILNCGAEEEIAYEEKNTYIEGKTSLEGNASIEGAAANVSAGTEANGAAGADGSLSPFFKGGDTGRIAAIVALAAPNNGTTAYDMYLDPTFDPSAIEVPEEYVKVGGMVSMGTKAREDGRIEEDHAAYDMHIDNAYALNAKIPTFEDVYYFTFPCSTAIVKEDGSIEPDASITESIFMKSAIYMSHYTGSTQGGIPLDESWRSNDGLVNEVSAMAPSGTPWETYEEGVTLRPGVWYVMPTTVGDHMSLQGGLTKRVDVKPFYLKLAEMLAGIR